MGVSWLQWGSRDTVSSLLRRQEWESAGHSTSALLLSLPSLVTQPKIPGMARHLWWADVSLSPTDRPTSQVSLDSAMFAVTTNYHTGRFRQGAPCL